MGTLAETGCFLLVVLAAAPLVPAEPTSEQRPGSGDATAPLVATLKPNGSATSFEFETDRIQGTIRLDGAYHGVTRLVDRRTGRQFIDARYSALNLFKVMSVNLAMAVPRTMERTVEVSTSHVQVRFAATESHLADVVARYEVSAADAIDLTVTVRCKGTYPGYELFLSSYFDKALRPHVYLQPSRGQPARSDAERILPVINDAFRGTVLVFPRDAHAARRCVDGRWDRSEGKTPTVQMCPVRRYAHCLAVMADADESQGLTLMSCPTHCYAISTRYHAEADADRMTNYSAFDLSLFGDDFLPGDERTVKVRLAVTPLDAGWDEPLRRYRAFLAENGAQTPSPLRSREEGKAR